MATINLAITSTRESLFFDLALFIFQTVDLSLLCREWLTGIDHSSLEPSDWQRSLDCVFYSFTKTACYQDGRTSQRKMKTLWLRKRVEAKATDDHCKSWQRPVYHNKDINLGLCDFETKLPLTDILVGDRPTCKYLELVSRTHALLDLKGQYKTESWILGTQTDTFPERIAALS